MLLHLAQQQSIALAKATSPTRLRAPPKLNSPPPSPPIPGARVREDFCSFMVEIAEVQSELMALWAEFEEFKNFYESSSSEASAHSSHSPYTAPTVVPHHPPSPSTESSMSVMQEGTAHPSHSWLQPILDHPQCPAFIQHVDSSMVPILSYALPDDVPQSVIVTYTKGSPRHLGLDSNGDLCVAATGNSERVVIFLAAPPGAPFPRPSPHSWSSSRVLFPLPLPYSINPVRPP